MRIPRLLIHALLSLAAVCSAQSIKVKIVAFNDFHGNLKSPGNASGAPGEPAVPVGGVDYLAAYIARLKSVNPHNIVICAGDVVGASPFLSASYHDEATIEAMNLAGLNLASVGNHEFDGGSAELLRKQHGGCLTNGKPTCLEHHRFPGAKFEYLSANVFTTADNKTLFPRYAIKRSGGVKIAFIGLVLKDTPTIVTASGVAGLSFKDEADTVNALIPELRAKHVNAIVVVIHQGGMPTAAASINACPGQLGNSSASPILDVVSRLDDAVDLVISAHSHVAYNCRLPNSKGRPIPVTQASAFGKMLTDFDLTVDKHTGHVTNITANNLLVSQPEANSPDSPVHPFLASAQVEKIRGLVSYYTVAVQSITSKVIGSIAAPLTDSLNMNDEQMIGDLVQDAELGVTALPNPAAAVISLGNSSGIRAPINPQGATYPYNVTYGDAFSARPFGNTLMTVTLTAQNLKDLLEQQFSGCLGQTQDSPLEVSVGFHFEWSASAAPCSKIVNVTLAGESIVSNGVVQNPTKTYRVTVDNFIGSGKGNFTVILKGTDPVNGPLDIDSIVTYMTKQHTAPNPPYAVQQSPRIVKLP